MLIPILKTHNTPYGDETWVLIHVEVQGEPEDAFDLMYERGYSKQQIQELFNVIDWMIQIPSTLDEDFLNAIYVIEEDKKMPYINTAEKVGLEKGRQEGRQETLRATAKSLIEIKFGELPEWVTRQLQEASANQLDTWIKNILTAESLESLLGKH
ncbi:hypothetical protein [Nitrincola nitratireducens]|uniref:DUF4351 domain-containing protein n=1 Tax=Nitrincola nitratireducens TaxID=1229521 RepID=W9UPK1_9GAMM|nr:hypothetical protein [Nitrincola nitratireducens]EXJ09133.1 hypothetical protein D791_03920 [Nitrincola nitratireducens]